MVKNYNKNKNVEEWNNVTKKLALMEHFCVGINNKVYDITILNAMAGNMIMETWINLDAIIKQKRRRQNGEANYKEFEDTVKKLK